VAQRELEPSILRAKRAATILTSDLSLFFEKLMFENKKMVNGRRRAAVPSVQIRALIELAAFHDRDL
jgi:hypothetical protein